MERDSSIHIKRSDLERILGIVLEMDTETIKDISNRVIELSYKSRCSHRGIILGRGRVCKKGLASLSGDDNFLNNFWNIFELHKSGRLEYQYLNIDISDTKSKDYVLLRNIAVVVKSYVNLFYNGNDSEGILSYININLRLVGKKLFTLNSFIYNENRIKEITYNMIELSQYELLPEFNDLYKYYIESVYNISGVEVDYSLPEYKVEFCRVYDLIKSRGVSIKEWIDAQFYIMGQSNIVPIPKLLYSHGSIMNYASYKKRNGGIANNIYNGNLSISERSIDY